MNKKLLIVLIVLLIAASITAIVVGLFLKPGQQVSTEIEHEEKAGTVQVRPMTKEEAADIKGKAFKYDFEQEQEIRYFLDDKMLIVSPSEENAGWETLWSKYRVDGDKIVVESDVEEPLDIELKGSDLILNGVQYRAVNLTRTSDLIGTWEGDREVTFLDDDYLITVNDGDINFYEYDIDDNQLTLTSGELDSVMTFKRKGDTIRINGEKFRRTDGKESNESN